MGLHHFVKNRTFLLQKNSIIRKTIRVFLLYGGNANRLKQGQHLFEIYQMLIPTFDGRDRAIGNQLAKGIFGDLGFGIKLLV